MARKHLEGVAKGWCETIRASQVIPVYPLTEDLVPGDVFLVQTPIGSQASLYNKKGFLALDDHRTRLKTIDYSHLYFDGYWKDDFGQTPHLRVKLANAGALPEDGSAKPVLTDLPAPRAAFPSYSFHAKSGSGLALAVPIQGVPVGLNFLHADSVNGSVTIADAHTYAADEAQLYHALQQWINCDDTRVVLDETVRRAHHPVFIRVISRVYLTDAVIVSLSRAGSTGAALKAGSAPNVKLVDAQGNVNQNYQDVLSALDDQANPLAAVKQAGGAVKFVAASDSNVAMAESFDRPLVVGYLGFDVPVFAGGDIGAPIPTFERLTHRVADPPPVRVGPLTVQQDRFRVSQDALEALTKTQPTQAFLVMNAVLQRLYEPEFAEARAALKAAQPAQAGQPPTSHQVEALFKAFKAGAIDYVTLQGNRGARYDRFDMIFSRAYDQKDKKQ